MKTISKNILLVAASMLALQGAAFAQANAGWYIGGSVGKAEIKPKIDFATGTQDKSSTGYKLYGGYQLDSTWAVEVQLQNLGKYMYTNPGVENLKLKDNGVSVAAVGYVPLAKDFSLLGKAGVAIRHMTYDDIYTNGSASGSKTQSSLLLGFGAEYDLSPNLALRAEYEYFGQPKLEETKIKSSLFSIGLRYKF